MPYKDYEYRKVRARLQAKRYYATHREDKLVKTGLYQKQNPQPTVKSMFSAAKNRAKTKGVPFDIDVSDIIIPEFCPVLGLRLVSHIGRRGPLDDTPSLDRIRPEGGYVRGNIWVISSRANRMKNDATLGELELLVLALKKLQV